jgi:adenylate cyclase
MISASSVLAARILIVDDQPANVALLERMLKGGGYTSVTSTSNPTQVYEFHRLNHYDLILLDLNMPVMDGVAVMHSLKALEVDGYLPVVVITADPGQKLRALNAGARDFISKPVELAEVLIRVYNMVEVRLLHLASKKHCDELVAEQKVSERLLRNMLPHAIAERLKGRPADSFSELIADNFEDVTVLFADLVGFTSFSERVSPRVMVDVLNDIFTRFDVIADARGLEKIKTIGDAYMAVAGLPSPVADHSARAAHMALDMMDAVERHNVGSGHKLEVRIGLSTGAVVAGVIGKRKFLYDVWGDTVNTASRMESHGVTGRIQMTDSTRARLTDSFSFEERGSIEVKGKGEMHTWFLNGRSADLRRTG